MPSSCQSSTMFVHNFHRLSLRNSPKFRCVLDQIGPNPAVSSSLSSVFTSANLIAAAAAASGSGSLHGAVTSTITQVAVTAVAIASGACLSTKVDFLWPKLETQPGSFRMIPKQFVSTSTIKGCVLDPVQGVI